MRAGLLAVDLGTSKAKAGLFDLDGNLLRFAEREYGLLQGVAPGWVEQDPEQWWQATCEALRALRPGESGLRVLGLAIGGQGPSVVAVDAAGRPLAHALIWMDARAEPERRWLSERLGEEVSPFSCLPKVLWLKRHRPDVYHQARWFLQAWDYLAYRLTGSAVSSTFAGGSVFPDDLVAAGELDRARLPPQIAWGEVGGYLRPTVAEALGLPPGLPVAGGVNDATASMLGAAILTRGRAIDTGGTSGGFGLCWDERLVGEGIVSWPMPWPGLYYCGGAMAAAGQSLDWFLATFGYARSDLETVLRRAAGVPPGAEGLVFLPYLAGERAPLWDPEARGLLFGLTLRHTRDHCARAVLEGVAFSLRHVADVVLTAGGQVEELRVCGGQARSRLWNQIKADVTGFRVAVPRVTEVALLGVAVLAGVAAGCFADLVQGAERLVHLDHYLEPDPERHSIYDAVYDVYRQLYPAVRPLYRELAAAVRPAGPV